MSKAVIFFAPGLEECEGLLCVDILRRAGVEVTIAAVGGEKIVKSARQISVVADALAEELDYTVFDACILPGGIPGVPNLKADATVRRVCRDFAAEGKVVAAICAAPTAIRPGRSFAATNCAAIAAACAAFCLLAGTAHADPGFPLKQLEALGHEVEIDADALASSQRFAGDDATRLAAIHRAAASGADVALISRGGSSMLFTMIAFGMILSVSRQNDEQSHDRPRAETLYER